MFKVITHGFVVQTFDDNGHCTDQEFIAGDNVEYEDEDGETIGEFDEPDHEYQPLDMVQPGKVDVA